MKIKHLKRIKKMCHYYHKDGILYVIYNRSKDVETYTDGFFGETAIQSFISEYGKRFIGVEFGGKYWHRINYRRHQNEYNKLKLK